MIFKSHEHPDSCKTSKINTIMNQREFCDHIEDDDLFEKYPDPILVESNDRSKCICISWVGYQKILRKIELARKQLRPGYDPEKEVTLKMTMDQDIYNQLEIICAECGHTVAGVTEEFFRWVAKHPEAVRAWVEECRKDGTLDECINNPFGELKQEEPEA